MSDETDVLPAQDELRTLKARAERLGVNYHPSIGVEKLREKIAAAITAGGDADAPPGATPTDRDAHVEIAETPNQRRARLKREASELVRIRVTSMNPAKADWAGEIITVGNSAVGSFTKYVPYNAGDGWHVPRIIYQQLLERQCQVFVTSTDARGNTTRRGKLIKEYAIELLAPLTAGELHDLAQRQALARAID